MQRHYLIDLPKASGPRPLGSVVLVTPDSSQKYLKHVERFARYFLREMHYGGIQFEAASDARNSQWFSVEWRAFLLAHEDRYIGAGCFRYRPEQSEKVPWVFDWLWIHPYCRRRGHLSRSWDAMVGEMQNFRLQKPLSAAMEAFALKIKWDPKHGRIG